MALRLYIKLLLNSAWNWGSWAFIMQMIYLQPVGNPPFKPIPKYVHVFYSIWECVFFLALLLFIEKFILQLIGKTTSCSADPDGILTIPI